MSPKLFVSYRSKDARFVRSYVEALKANGVDVWMDEYGIRHTQVEAFQEVIHKAIEHTDWGILFVSDTFSDSEHCRDEVDLLLKLDKNIVVLFLGGEDKFRKLYKDHEKKSVLYTHIDKSTNWNQDRIFKALTDAGALTTSITIDYSYPFRSRPRSWHVMEAGFTFDYDGWRIDHKARFNPSAIAGEKQTIFAETDRIEYDVFERLIGQHTVRLWFDYNQYDGALAESVRLRKKREKNDSLKKAYEMEDRERLKEELLGFISEAESVYKRITMPGDAEAMREYTPVDLPEEDIEEVGVHLYSLEDRGDVDPHRLFSFKIISKNKIYRVYKLVTPHPQLDIAFDIRFTFEFENDLTHFFSAIPVCDKLVDSFGWVSEVSFDELTIDSTIIQAARKRFMRQV